MMTPIEMQGHIFKSGRGYQKSDVDEFLEEVAKDYEQLYRENVELKDKISTLSDGLQYYKDLEKTLQKTLVVAEKTAEETRQSAQKNAEAVVAKAQVKAEALLSSIRSEAESTVNQIEMLHKQYENYRIQCKQLANAQLELLDSEAFQITMNTDYDFSMLKTSDRADSTELTEEEESISPSRYHKTSKEMPSEKEGDKLNRSLFHLGATLGEDASLKEKNDPTRMRVSEIMKERSLAKSSLDFLNERREKAARRAMEEEEMKILENNGPQAYDPDNPKGEPISEERMRELLLKRERAMEIRNAEGLKHKERTMDSSAEDAKNRLKVDTGVADTVNDLADDLFEDDLFEFINPDEEE